jgi:ESCRT-I complex subunit VPS28
MIPTAIPQSASALPIPPLPLGAGGVQQQHKAPAPPKEEVKLHMTARDREMYDNQADLYAIIKTMEHLEKAYVKDAISAEAYTPACTKLIAQYRTARGLVDADVDRFVAEYKLDCSAALKRLKSGIPATVEHQGGGSGSGEVGRPDAVVVAQTVQHFITAMDSLKLNMVAVDSLFPLLTELLEALNKMPNLSPDFEGKAKIRAWVATLNRMKASDELDQEQSRQLLFDLESSYTAFHKSLK